MKKMVISMAKLSMTCLIMGIVSLLIAGCGDTTNQRLARIAETSLESQARQNDQLAEHTGQISEASNNLVTADSEARKVMIESHASLQSQIENIRSNLDRQRNELEQERKDIASDREREPIIANAILGLGGTIACLLPLFLVGYLIHSLRHSTPEDSAVNEVLLREVITERKSYLLSDDQRPALGPPSSKNSSPTT